MAPISKKKILIVDDHRSMRKIIRNMLVQMSFEHIDEAANGLSALARLSQGTYDLIIADLNMEPMNGIELLKEVRSDFRFRDIPLIMVTAERSPDCVVAAKQAGVSGYVLKPFNLATLRAKVSTVLDFI